jgi:arginine deiminase
MYRVDSEVGPLRQVILHRPGLELKRLTPGNKDRLLFDDVLWVHRAQEEHDRFAEVLRERGITVHLFGELLRTTVELPDAKAHILDAIFDDRIYGPLAIDALRNCFDAMDPRHAHRPPRRRDHRSARCSTGSPSPARSPSTCSRPTTSCSNRCPTTSTPADTSAWLYGGVAINSMRKKARVRETAHYEAIYRWHPLFAGQPFAIWSAGAENGLATTEGGDMLVLGGGALLVGMSERTVPAGVERLARRLFAGGEVDRIVGAAHAGDPGVDAPRHRDDHGRPGDLHEVRGPRHAARLHDPPRRQREGAARLRPPAGAHARGDRRRRWAWPSCAVLTAEQDVHAAEREQWDDGCNTLAVAPGVGRDLRAQRHHQHVPARARHRGPRHPRRRARPGRGRARGA